MNPLAELIQVSGHRIKNLARKPKVFTAVVRSFVRARIVRGPALYMVDLNITKRCNFSCEHCFATAFDRGEAEPSTELVKSTIQRCKDAGVVFFNLQGGEPLLRNDLKEIIEFCNPRETSVMVNTNGSLLHRDRIRELASWGTYGLLISVDSLTPEEHDLRRRKEGALQHILDNVRWMQEAGLVAHFLTVVTRQSVYTPGFEQLIEFAGRRKIPVGLLVAQRVGQWASRPDVMCTPKELRILDEINRKYSFIRRDVHNTLSTSGCPAFKYSVYVTPAGEVCPCPFVHVSYGNLHKQNLVDICRLAQTHHYFNDFAPKCPAAENARFIEEVQAKTWGREKLPVPIADIVELDDLPRKRNVPKDAVRRCPVCEGTDRRAVFEAREHEYKNTTRELFHFHECAGCGALFMDPRPAKAALGTIYPHNYYSYSGPSLDEILGERDEGHLARFLSWRRERRYDYVRPHLTCPNPRWLEVGAAQGRNLLSAAKTFGAEATGIDIGFPEGTRRTDRATFIGADFMQHDFGSSRFDVVYSAHLIEHLPSPVAFLRRCYTLLEPGGLCVFETPNAESRLRHLLGPQWGGLHVPRHWVLLGPRTVRAAAERSGFEVEELHEAPNWSFLLWSGHALLEQRVAAPAIADALFPSEDILRPTFPNYARFVAFQTASTALSRGFASGENLHAILRKSARYSRRP